MTSPSIEAVSLTDIVDGNIANFYGIRNPDKLAALTVARTITRDGTAAH